MSWNSDRSKNYKSKPSLQKQSLYIMYDKILTKKDKNAKCLSRYTVETGQSGDILHCRLSGFVDRKDLLNSKEFLY